MNTENMNTSDAGIEEATDARETISPSVLETSSAETPDVAGTTEGELSSPTDAPGVNGTESKKPRRRKKNTDEADAQIDTESTEEKPKKPRTRRTKKSEALPEDNIENAVALPEAEEAAEEKPKKPRTRRTKKSEALTEDNVENAVASPEAEAAEEKPKRQRKKRKKTDDEAASTDSGETVLESDKSKEDISSTAEGPASEASESVPEDGDPTETFIIPENPSFDEQALALGNDVTEPELDILGDPIKEETYVEEISESAPAAFEPRPLTKREPKYNEEKPRRVDFLFDFVELFVITLVAVLVITTFFIRHSVVEGTSMENTLHEGDVLIISDLFYTPNRGDIVVVQDTSTVLKKPIVKRVIGLEGEVVRVARDGIYVNGEKLDEDYVFTDNLNYTYHTLPADELFNYEGFSIKFEEVDGKQLLLYYEFVVPDGELFVMGDHRNVSTDSRAIGTVKLDAVLGRVLFRLFPFDVFGVVE